MPNTPSWIDLSAARRRLSEINGELDRLGNERRLIEMVLGERKGEGKLPREEPIENERPDTGGPIAKVVKGGKLQIPIADLVVEALRQSPPQGSTVAEIMRHIALRHADRVADPRASATVSSAIGKARATKNPRIKILKRGGKGEPSRYAAI
jgi:hypothetical protein